MFSIEFLCLLVFIAPVFFLKGDSSASSDSTFHSQDYDESDIFEKIYDFPEEFESGFGAGSVALNKITPHNPLI